MLSTLQPGYTISRLPSSQNLHSPKGIYIRYSPRNLQPVPEHLVLLIRQIGELDILCYFCLGGRAVVPFPVRPPVVGPEAQAHAHGEDAGDGHGQFGREELGRVAVPEREGAKDVAQRVGHEEHRVGRDLLGVARHVGANPRVHQRDRGARDVGQVHARKPGAPLAGGGKGHQAVAHEARHQEREDAQRALVEIGREPAAAQRGQDRDDGAGELQQGARLGVPAEAADDDGLEAGDGAGRDLDGREHEGEEPVLRILQGLEALVLLENLVFDARLVLPHALNGMILLVLGESRYHGAVGEQEKGHDPAGNSDEADNQKHNLPRLELVAVVVLEAVRGEGSDDAAESRAAVPQTLNQPGQLRDTLKRGV